MLLQRNLEEAARFRDIAAEAYLVRLGKERIIFLQDAAVLWEEWKDLVMYQDPVFRHPLWQGFREEVVEMCERVNDNLTTEADRFDLPKEVRRPRTCIRIVYSSFFPEHLVHAEPRLFGLREGRLPRRFEASEEFEVPGIFRKHWSETNQQSNVLPALYTTFLDCDCF